MLSPELPELCWVQHPTNGTAVLVKRGEKGYYPTDYDPPLPGFMAAEFNKKLGVTDAQAMAMKHGSMFGWNSTLADPASWRSKGL